MITWSYVTVAIPTVPERWRALGALLHQVAGLCPGAAIVVANHVPDTPARVDFPHVLAVAARMGRPWVLQLEDDVVLAPTFGEAALAHGLDDVTGVVTLFSRSKLDVEAWSAGHPLRRIPAGAFSMSQAFFIRRELAAGVEAFAPDWYAAHPEHNRAADLLLGAYLREQKAEVRVRVPSLVQHRGLPSTLPGHRGARQSETYRAAFGEIAPAFGEVG